jgi:hypothetical protein
MSSVKERPIVFSAPMVRSILEGQKTVTRSPIKDQPPTGHKWRGWVLDSTCSKDIGKASWGEGDGSLLRKAVYARCPYGKPGDRLWVRETFATLGAGDYEPVKPAKGYGQDIRYSATDPLAGLCADTRGYKWRASVQMPRWASRILLEVTAIRVERLHDRTDGSLWAEGFATFGDGDNDWNSRHEAQGLGFSVNPWTWVVEFKRVMR